MLIAKLTARGAGRVLDGREGQCLPVHHAFKRTDGEWCLCVSDFLRTQEGLLPFQPWSLGEGDYSLWQATYDGGGWTYTPAPHALLAHLDTGRGEGDYVKKFPTAVQPYVDRIYQDGFEDGAGQTAETAYKAGHLDGQRHWGIPVEADADVDYADWVKEQ